MTFTRCIKTYKDAPDTISKGEILPVIIQDGKPTAIKCHPNGETHFNLADEDKEYFEPATQEDFQNQINQLQTHIHTLLQSQDGIIREIDSLQTGSTPALHSGETPAMETGMTKLPDAKSPSDLRNKALLTKKTTKEYTENLKKATDTLIYKIQEQTRIAKAAEQQLKNKLSDLNYIIDTINLYLGSAEEIIPLQDGEPEPASTPVHIRQTVLYMDEETALNLRDFDHTSIPKFDQWLLEKPEHLAQILPNPKGIVVLQPRRESRSCTLLEDQIENARSYWLIRNGKRLHRILSPLHIGEFLIPRQDSPLHNLRQENGKPLRPGTQEYETRMKHEETNVRRQMQAALLLQGIFDRTRLFHPWEGPLPNLLDDNTWNEKIKIIRDTDSTLHDGRPSFYQWLQKTNGRIREGLRICGDFPTWSEYKNRIEPQSARMSGPKANKTHTIVKTKHGYYQILFERDDYNWTTGKNFTKRASYLIHETDGFWICIDNASIPDMEYYLNDRSNRRHYETMVPALQTAINLKKQEIATEKPFRLLLLQELKKIDETCQETTLDDLITWYKNKTKDQRPILPHDSNAFLKILNSFKAATRKKIPCRPQDFGNPDQILLIHLSPNGITVLKTQPDEKLYTTKEIWEKSKGKWELHKTTEFFIPQKRKILPPSILFQNKEWETWPDDLHHSQLHHLPKALETKLIETASATPLEPDEKLLCINKRDKNSGYYLAIAKFPEKKQKTEKFLAWQHITPAINCHYIHWDKTFNFLPLERNHTYRYISKNNKTLTNTGDKNESGTETLWVDKNLAAQIEALHDEDKKNNNHIQSLKCWADKNKESAENTRFNAWKKAQLEKYLADRGHPDLFPDYLKTLFKPDTKTPFIQETLECLLNQGHKKTALTGITASQLLKLAGRPPNQTATDLDSLGWTTS
jgi:hypothetical protein